MIRFDAKFQVYDSPRVGVPRVKRFQENFWCSLNTKKQLIMCNVIYLGEDENMLQHKWYDGIIELPYGEKFPPYCSKIDAKLSEPINLFEEYFLNIGGEVVGKCKMYKVIEIIKDDFNIIHHKDGTI